MIHFLRALDRGVGGFMLEVDTQRERAERLEARVIELEAALHELEGSAGLREQLDSSVKTNQELTSMLSHHAGALQELERTTHECGALRVQLESCVRTNQLLTTANEGLMSTIEAHKCPKPARCRKVARHTSSR